MKTVFVSGNFNIVHPGHLRILRYAKECGEKLIVAVQSDRIAGKAVYVQEQLRLEGVTANQWVDEAFLCDEPVVNAISRIKPSIVVKGREYANMFNPEQAVLDSYGGSLLFSSGETVFSSLDLLRRDFQKSNFSTIALPTVYMERHGVRIDALNSLVNRLSDLNVCVIGDLIVDEYITCAALGMSQEDPTLVVMPVDSKQFVGGAGIVAAHAAGLGANVTLITVGGNDEARTYAEKKFNEYGVDAHIVIDETRLTSLKQRYRANGKTLLRVSKLRQSAISSELQAVILDAVKKLLPDCDLLIFSDFNYGCLPQKLVDEITSLAHTGKTMLVADSQSSSQNGNIARFRNMDLITPTEREARISTHNHEDGLIMLAEKLRKSAEAKNVFLTLGEEGVLIHAECGPDAPWLTDQLESLNNAPKDVAGAGDCLLTAATLAMAAKGSIWEAACLGSIAAAIQVGRVGNTPLTIDEVYAELNNMSAASSAL